MTKRAVICVEDTRNLVEFAGYLVSAGWTILSAGKTGEFLRKERIPFQYEKGIAESPDINADTFMLIKKVMSTRIDGAGSSSQDDTFRENNIQILCVNVQPPAFAGPLAEEPHGIPNLPVTSLVRSSFANYGNILMLTDPGDYKEAMIQLRTDSVTPEFRRYLAGKAMNMISAFDGAVALGILKDSTGDDPFMNYLTFPFAKEMVFHGGVNPQQKSCLYSMTRSMGAASGFRKLHGPELNYNVICDLSLAWDQISSLYACLKNQLTVKSVNSDGYEFTTQFTPCTGTVFTVAVKRRSIVGGALSTNVLDSFLKTFTYDSQNIDDVTVGCSAVIDSKAALEMVKTDFAAIIAPGFTSEAKEILSANRNIRLIPTAKVSLQLFDIQLVNGGLLVQSKDHVLFGQWNVRTKNRPSQFLSDEMAIGMLLVMGPRSYSCILMKGNAIVGISQACTSPLKSVDSVLSEAVENAERNPGQNQDGILADVLVSDTAIPFCLSVRTLIDRGVKAIIQTGGTPDDGEFIKYCDERGVVMIFTGMTHIAY